MKKGCIWIYQLPIGSFRSVENARNFAMYQLIFRQLYVWWALVACFSTQWKHESLVPCTVRPAISYHTFSIFSIIFNFFHGLDEDDVTRLYTGRTACLLESSRTKTIVILSSVTMNDLLPRVAWSFFLPSKLETFSLTTRGKRSFVPQPCHLLRPDVNIIPSLLVLLLQRAMLLLLVAMFRDLFWSGNKNTESSE